MQPFDLWTLAQRGLTRRPARTLLTTLGITVAVASMVIFLSLGEGLRRVFAAELSSVGPDISLTAAGLGQGFAPPPNLDQAELTGRVQELAGELGINSITPVVTAIRGGLDISQVTVLYGVPAAGGMTTLYPKLSAAQGRLLAPADEGQPVAVLGGKAAENMGLDIGGTLNLTRSARAEVVGILAPESGFVDNFVFLPITTLQEAESAQGRVSSLSIGLEQPTRSREVADALSERLDLDASTQSDFLSFIDRALRISDAVRFGISLIALIVGGLAVANTVMMGVFERTREFGTMRALGATPALVQRLVLGESLLLSMVGGVFGVLVGLAGIWAVNLYTQNLAGIAAAALTPRLVLLALAVSLLLGLLSGLLPARAAGRIPIVQALGRI